MSLNSILIKSAIWAKNADVSKMGVCKCSMGGFLKVLIFLQRLVVIGHAYQSLRKFMNKTPGMNRVNF